MQIEYDPEKNRRNIAIRGIPFADAVELLTGPHVERRDERRGYPEERFVAYGLIRQRLHVCEATSAVSSRCERRTGERSMPMVRMSFAEARAKAAKEKVDWQRIDAMTDEDIARQIAEGPDVAPDMSEALERGEFEVVWGIDLEHLRQAVGLDQKAFAQRFGFPLDEFIDWEAKGRVPDRAIWMYLKLIEHEPEVASRAAEAIMRGLVPKVLVP